MRVLEGEVRGVGALGLLGYRMLAVQERVDVVELRLGALGGVLGR